MNGFQWLFVSVVLIIFACFIAYIAATLYKSRDIRILVPRQVEVPLVILVNFDLFDR
jgi:hypothetical protein